MGQQTATASPGMRVSDSRSNSWKFANSWRLILQRLPCRARSPPTAMVAVRTYDGTGNNLANTELGSTNEQLIHVAGTDYGDGISTLAGADRPDARVISNALAAQDEETELNERKLSAYIYVFGQFLDHDIDLTEPPTTNKESAPIAIPAGDAYFDPNSTGTQTISFTRSRYDETTGTGTANPREQINQITSWIDGSSDLRLGQNDGRQSANVLRRPNENQRRKPAARRFHRQFSGRRHSGE